MINQTTQNTLWSYIILLGFAMVLDSCDTNTFVGQGSASSSKASTTSPKSTVTTVNSVDTAGGTTTTDTTTPTPTPTPTQFVIKPPVLDDTPYTMTHTGISSNTYTNFWVVTLNIPNTNPAKFPHGLGGIYYFNVNNAALTDSTGKADISSFAPAKVWTYAMVPGQTGARTYVLEGGGLVFAVVGGYVFYVDPQTTPTGNIPYSCTPCPANLDNNPANPNKCSTTGQICTADPNYPLNFFQFPIFTVANKYTAPNSGDRGCTVSYRKGPQRYLGIGYGYGSFLNFQMSATPPYAPVWDSMTSIPGWGPSGSSVLYNYDTGNGGVNVLWGYSCYIDQNKLYFYSQYWTGSAKVLSLANLGPTSYVPAAAAATNSTLVPTDPTIKGAVNGVKDHGSYSLSGDLRGNLLNGYNSGDTNNFGYYALASDDTNGVIWGTSGSKYPNTGTISIFKSECLTNNNSCTASDYSAWGDTAEGITLGLGPISSIKIGGVIALARNRANPTVGSDVWYLSLSNKTDLSKPPKVKKLATVPGESYMYTDFTGATLYSVPQNTYTFDFTTMKTFDPTKNVQYLTFDWTTVAGASTTWSNLQLQAACYAGSTNTATLANVDNVVSAGSNAKTLIKVPSCANQDVDHVQLQITQLNGDSTMSNIDAISVAFYQ